MSRSRSRLLPLYRKRVQEVVITMRDVVGRMGMGPGMERKGYKNNILYDLLAHATSVHLRMAEAPSPLSHWIGQGTPWRRKVLVTLERAHCA